MSLSSDRRINQRCVCIYPDLTDVLHEPYRWIGVDSGDQSTPTHTLINGDPLQIVQFCNLMEHCKFL